MTAVHPRALFLMLALATTVPSLVRSAGFEDTDDGKKLVSLVDKATALLQAKGDGAYAELRHEGSEFRHDDTYIFVLELTGKALFHGAKPELENTDLSLLKDSDGKEFVKTMIEDARTAGHGWVEYKWPRPGQDNPVPKLSYIEKGTVGDKEVFIGAGVYLDAGPPASPAPSAKPE